MAIRQPIITIAGHVDHGKCVAGDTRIILNTGEIKTAKDIFNENFEEYNAINIEDGVFQDISKKGINISSFDGKKIINKPISHIWRRESKKLVDIKIASGDTIQTTPEHLFLVFHDDAIYEKRADTISKEDYIVFPEKIVTTDIQIKSKLIERIKKLDNFVCFLNGNFEKVFHQIFKEGYKHIEKKLSLKNISKNLKKRRLRIKELFLIGCYLGISEEEIYSTIDSLKNSNNKRRAGHTSKEVSLPSLNNLEDLGYVLGCLAGDGHLSNTNAILNNNDKDIQESYCRSLKQVFNLESKIKIGHTCQIVMDNGGKTFVRILNELFDIPIGNKSGKISVPEIAKTNKEVFKGFFAGLFDTDGYVSSINNSIEITSKSKEIIKDCAILLLNFGILSSKFEKNGFYYLRISNKNYLKSFLENISPRLERRIERTIKSYEKSQSSRIFDILPINSSKFKTLKFQLKKNVAVPYFNKYLKSQNLTRDFALKVINNLKEDNHFSNQLKYLLESDIRFVKVTEKKEIINAEKYVYDFTVPETKNFIAERFVIHNTSILDAFRESNLQQAEAGGITQKISFTKYPIEQIKCACPLIEKNKIKLEIPGFLFIDTPGHAAFTQLRKRGGSLADLAIVVVAVKEGIQPQTAEVLQILKNNNVPFVIALNKIDSISGWTKRGELKESIESQAMNVSQEFQEALLTFQGSLREHGFDSSLFYEIKDYTKQVAIVPCSARTKEGISELLFMLCGLCQRFFKERLKVGNDAKGIILEVKKEKNAEYIESILYDGELKENDMIAIATFNDIITSKVRAIEEIQPLSLKYSPIKKAHAATGIRLNLTNKEGILAGMPFQKIHNNLEKIKEEFKKEISEVMHLDKEGIIIKADSLGSLEALITLLRQEKIQILKAGIGPINKTDIINAKANLELNPLDAIILGFNVKLEDDTEKRNVKIITNDVVYKLIEDLTLYRKNKQAEIEKEKLMGLATICKLQILPEYVFRNSNPAIFGVRVLAGKLKVGIPMMDEKGEEVARVKSIQHEKTTVIEATEGQELALALPGLAFDRRLKEVKYLYAYISDKQFKDFKKNKELLSANELKVLQEIALIKNY